MNDLAVNWGVAIYITALLAVLLVICFVGQARQDAKKKNEGK